MSPRANLTIIPGLSIIENVSSKNLIMAQDNFKAPIGLSPTLNTTPDNVKIKPDDLFARNTILEIRGIQANLRADAEAKREELRLMVGERYRDLLQASSSIISMSNASMQVKTALEDVKDTILSQDAPPPPKRTSIRGLDDAHLHVFQLLSAHMKLLLDAPEHLWRLMERKKYFVAAWLFLLTRVVHRTLVKEPDQDDGAWSSKGIDVVDQFPIVQRQWEVVSQFRTQIVHKATLALREVSISPEEACAMMLTLHVLDSRPMSGALGVFLDQRSKALRTSLQWKPKHKHSLSDSGGGTSGQANGSAMTSSQKITLQEVKIAIHAALDTLFSTISVGRQIFHATPSAQPLMDRVLEHIQAGSSSLVVNDTNAPDLYLTSQSLLSSLPSSTHFLLLPANIRNYKPFIDTNSQSTNVSQATLDHKLDAWFSKSVDFVHNSIEKWLGGLQSIKEVWRMRLATRAWTESSDLLPTEKQKLGQVFDGTYGKRISDIWSVQLIETQKIFEEALATLSAGKDDATDCQRDQSASLFQAQPLSTQILKGSDDAAFKKYKSALVKQLSGRTGKLDTLVTSLEQCAELIQQDIGQIRSTNAYPSSELLDQLRQTYQPNADALCHAVFQNLDSVARHSGNDLGRLVFIDQLSMELGQSSFIHKIECSPEVVQEFQSNMHALHTWILEQWQERTMTQILVKSEPDISHSQSEPSYRLIQELGMLSYALCQLGFGHRGTEHTFVSKTLCLFVTRKLEAYSSHNGAVVPLGDVVFLRKLAELSPQSMDRDDLITTLDEHIAKHPSNPHVHTNVLSTLTRTQMLLAPLLPVEALKDVEGKSSMLLPYGIPPSEQQYRPPLELAKSSSRFGLLLVGGSTTMS